MKAPDHPREAERIASLQALELLDTAESETWDRLAELAAAICQTPISLISIVDSDRQWFKAHIGLETRETPRELAFCSHAILQDEVFVVQDALLDDRFVDNALVTGDPDIRSYAGAPIYASGGLPIGTVCAIDRRPRDLSDEQLHGLRLLADMATRLLDHRANSLRLRAFLDRSEPPRDLGGMVSALSEEFMNPITPIMVQLQQLRKEGVDEASLDVIERNVLRIRDTVRKACDDMSHG